MQCQDSHILPDGVRTKMIYTTLTKKAMRIAFAAHKEQVDKTGMPYIYHPIHLAEQMETEDEVCVALLHDVVEDTDMTLGDLRSHGFPENVLDALALLTHDDGVEYMDYIRRVKTNSLASKVKLADLRHNRNLARFDSHDWNLKQLIKYMDAILLIYDLRAKETESGPLRRERLRLDDTRLWFLSVFRGKDNSIVKYSINVEKAGDSHYELVPEEYNRLTRYFGTVDTIEALQKYFIDHSERDFVSLLDMLEVFYKPFHYD